MLGATVFALATWIRFQDDFQEWVVELGFHHYWHGIWTLFAGGIFMMMLGFVGCCATVSEIPGFILTVSTEYRWTSNLDVGIKKNTLPSFNDFLYQ
jgi:hypothetical protein